MDSVRRIEKLPTESLRAAADGSAQIVIDGRIVPLAGLAGKQPEGDEINLFRIADGGREIAYAYASIVDLCEFDPDDVVTTDSGGGRLALSGGRPIELFDARTLLADPAACSATES
jgi:hypothetical protein